MASLARTILEDHLERGELVPGQEIELRDAQPAADQFTVTLDGGERAVSEKAAAGLFVKPA